MALFELRIDERALHTVTATTFASEGVMERADLQAALRDRIEVIDPDLLVVAEEFGAFEAVNRRIDLLAIDRNARLVVLELKRTDDGGHMELQALRYAAMVSTMTFDQLVETFQAHLRRTTHADPSSARAVLAKHLEEAGGEDAVLERRVRIILVSAGFDPQITTTVLWLNDLYQLDITCIRLTPYRVDDRLLLDLQQVIPLPEAAELTVRLRERETAARAATTRTDGPDWTQYVISAPTGDSEPLRKRWAALRMVTELTRAGVDPQRIVPLLPASRLLPVEGVLSGQDLIDAFVAAHPGVPSDALRWFYESPIHVGEHTWVLSKRWGLNTEPTLAAMSDLAPGFTFRAVHE